MRNMPENQVEETIRLYLANNSILETARVSDYGGAVGK